MMEILYTENGKQKKKYAKRSSIDIFVSFFSDERISWILKLEKLPTVFWIFTLYVEWFVSIGLIIPTFGKKNIFLYITFTKTNH